MRFGLDHLVIAVHDLEKATVDYRALGFTVHPGGRHPGRTSHNALVVFGDGTYLELIAWYEPGPGDRWYESLTRHGEGLVDFALLPESVPDAVAEAKARGLELAGPIDGGRNRPDGTEVRWQTARQSTFDLPFLCGDVTPRNLRVPIGEMRRHANLAASMASVLVASFDLEASLGRYRALLGADAAATDIVAMPALGAHLATVALGRSAIVLMKPSHDALRRSGPLVDELHKRLDARGEGPFAFALRRPGQPTQVLDPRLTHGVLVEISA